MAAPATAATLTINTPCVIETAPKIDFSIAGFAPDALVNLNDNGSFLDVVTAGTDGSFVGQFSASHTADGRQTHTLVATDPAGNSASGSYFVTELGFLQTPAVAKPTAKVTYAFEGFIGGQTLYAHYTFSKSPTKKIPAKTVVLGKLQGPCGSLVTGKVPVLPVKKPKVGTYEIQFDTNAAYKRQEGVYLETYIYVPKSKKKKK